MQLVGNNTRSVATVQVYLLIRREDQILLSLRQNTGYNDGMYALVAGHVEEGESATNALIREAEEEVGIQILPQDLSVSHISHRRTNRNNVDVYYECSKWQGDLTNAEPQKCTELAFFSIDKLPHNTIPYIVAVIQAIERGHFYSEHGWG